MLNVFSTLCGELLLFLIHFAKNFIVHKKVDVFSKVMHMYVCVCMPVKQH